MKLTVEGMISKTEMDEVHNKFKEFTPMQLYRDMKEDISDFVKRDEMNIISRDMDFV